MQDMNASTSCFSCSSLKKVSLVHKLMYGSRRCPRFSIKLVENVHANLTSSIQFLIWVKLEFVEYSFYCYPASYLVRDDLTVYDGGCYLIKGDGIYLCIDSISRMH